MMEASYSAIDKNSSAKRPRSMIVAFVFSAFGVTFLLAGIGGLAYYRSSLIGSDAARAEGNSLRALSLAKGASVALYAEGSSSQECSSVKLKDGEVLTWLRGRAFNRRTEERLANHPMVVAADSGEMPLEAVELVLLEEFSIETSDIRSMAMALGRHGDIQAAADFFQAATDSDATARKKLLEMAAVLGMSQAQLEAYVPMPTAHAYTAYLAELSNYGGMGVIAAGFAVNFPAYGRMCGRIRDALIKNYNICESDVGFLSWFAAPLGPDYDASATAVIAAGRKRGETLCEIERGVQLLQAYEQMFWDSVWADTTHKEHLTEPLHF
eukprot:TRINITY_DN40656_c0_g1_i1.p1 TRINITY_DN40656_c0_g1~~TRINITY_DN40656_c0_g1_i1.p1  ORF type:complete len:325 (+),score=55.19 TRINITY_DN40656_c0_g1_i1:44-1018(+)